MVVEAHGSETDRNFMFIFDSQKGQGNKFSQKSASVIKGLLHSTVYGLDEKLSLLGLKPFDPPTP
jgi:hypothetical protein